jgi:hypothetical protein
MYDNKNKFIYFNCSCAKLISKPKATLPGTRMREELCSLVSQRPRVLVSTVPKDACPFQFCFLLHPSIVSLAMPKISCYCVVMLVCAPIFACAFLGSRVVCFINHFVSSPVFPWRSKASTLNCVTLLLSSLWRAPL